MLVHPEVMGVEALFEKMRKIPDWPEKGILFHDITPILQSPQYFRLLVDLLVYRYMGQKIDAVAGLDARGFIIGAALAYQLNVGFVPIRKKGKLPLPPCRRNTRWNTARRWWNPHRRARTGGRRYCWWTIWWPQAARCWRARN